MADTAAKAPKTTEGKRRGRAPGSKVVPATVDLDFTKTATEDQLEAAQPVRRSAWVNQLQALKDATLANKVAKGADGKPLYVLVGRFSQPGSAQQTIRNFETNKAKLPSGQWDFSKKVVLVDGKSGSELWARYLGESESK